MTLKPMPTHGWTSKEVNDLRLENPQAIVIDDWSRVSTGHRADEPVRTGTDLVGAAVIETARLWGSVWRAPIGWPVLVPVSPGVYVAGAISFLSGSGEWIEISCSDTVVPSDG